MFRNILYCLVFSIGLSLSVNAQIHRENDIVGFYATAGQGRTFPIKETNPWKDAYCFNINIPVSIKESIWDAHAGVNYYRRRYWQTGLTDYAFSTHLSFGKRYESKRILTGFYVGPSFMIIRHLTQHKSEFGLIFSAPITYKVLPELGLGMNWFCELSRNESMYGFMFIISLINIPK